MLWLFQGNFIFAEATSFSEWIFFQKLHFFRVTTSTQQLHFRSSCFFRTAAFFSLFRTVTFSQQLFFQNCFFFRAKILYSSHFLRIKSSLWQLLFGTAVFPCLGWRYLKRATFSKQVLLYSIKFFRKATFWKKQIFQKRNIPLYLPFLESCFFRVATFSKDGTFFSSYLFRRATFFNALFQKSYCFTTTLFFHRCTSNLFISN